MLDKRMEIEAVVSRLASGMTIAIGGLRPPPAGSDFSGRPTR